MSSEQSVASSQQPAVSSQQSVVSIVSIVSLLVASSQYPAVSTAIVSGRRAANHAQSPASQPECLGAGVAARAVMALYTEQGKGVSRWGGAAYHNISRHVSTYLDISRHAARAAALLYVREHRISLRDAQLACNSVRARAATAGAPGCNRRCSGLQP